MSLHGVISKRLPGSPSIAAVGGLTGLLSLVALHGCGGGGYTAPQTRWNALYEYTPIPLLQLRAGYRRYLGIPQSDAQNRQLAFVDVHAFLLGSQPEFPAHE